MNDYLLANKENLNWRYLLQTMKMKETNNHEENKTKLILFRSTLSIYQFIFRSDVFFFTFYWLLAIVNQIDSGHDSGQ